MPRTMLIVTGQIVDNFVKVMNIQLQKIAKSNHQ
jgi:hypothetical protein